MYLICNINDQVSQQKCKTNISSCLAPDTVGIHVEGEGVLADLYRSVANAFKSFELKMEIDNVLCLPNPIPPDIGCYIQIGTLTNPYRSKNFQ
jgi:hypothetical protein